MGQSLLVNARMHVQFAKTLENSRSGGMATRKWAWPKIFAHICIVKHPIAKILGSPLYMRSLINYTSIILRIIRVENYAGVISKSFNLKKGLY